MSWDHPWKQSEADSKPAPYQSSGSYFPSPPCPEGCSFGFSGFLVLLAVWVPSVGGDEWWEEKGAAMFSASFLSSQHPLTPCPVDSSGPYRGPQHPSLQRWGCADLLATQRYPFALWELSIEAFCNLAGNQWVLLIQFTSRETKTSWGSFHRLTHSGSYANVYSRVELGKLWLSV